MNNIDKLLRSNKRFCVFIPLDGFVEGRGWRPAFVFEGEAGYFPNGTWPYHGKVGETMPWFWGMTIEEAEAEAEAYNLKLGISKEDAFKIVNSSMIAQRQEEAGKRKGRR